MRMISSQQLDDGLIKRAFQSGTGVGGLASCSLAGYQDDSKSRTTRSLLKCE